MGKAFFISGTGTDIGKTIVTSSLYVILNKLGIKTKVFKPIQTGFNEKNQSFPDQYWYESELGMPAGSTGLYYMQPAVSPHLAASITNTSISIERIKEKIRELRHETDILLVEGSGGLAVPLIEENNRLYMTKDLIQECDLPTILVSLTGLGSIHHLLSTVSYTKEHDIKIQGMIFNQFNEKDIIHNDNVRMVEKISGICTILKLPVFNELRLYALNDFAQKLLTDEPYKYHLLEGLSIECLQ